MLSPSFYILQRYDTWRTACDKSADEPLRNIDEQIMSENPFFPFIMELSARLPTHVLAKRKPI